MTCSNIEIYPYKDYQNPVLKQLVSDNIHGDISIINYAHQQYLELFRPYADVKKIVSQVLLEIIKITKAQNGFLALVKNNSQVDYLCTYMDVAGVVFQSENGCCKMSTSNKSIVSRSLLKRRIVISNNIKTDPRSIGSKNLPKEHPTITNYLGIPLINESKLVGQIGIANCLSEFDLKTVERILPLVWFCSNFTWMWANKEHFDTRRELQLKQEVVSLKDSFIATMSHEIRTPLNGIVGMARLLSEADNLTLTQLDYIRILNECSVQLMELVNDILDFSKITSGGLSLNNAPFKLRTCIESSLDIVRQRAKDKGLTINKNITLNLPEVVNGDSRRLKQILINLLTNAIKFTDRGHVTLQAFGGEEIPRKSEFDPKQRRITFQIQDTGIGISSQNQQKIFQVFTKLTTDDGYTNTTPGAGLGLAISKELVTLMGGTISVDSDGKTGSTFTFDVLLEDETDVKSLLNLHQSILKNKIAIIVDDREDNRMYLMEILYSWGLKAVCFSSARETLSFIDLSKNFDLAIIDICMPGMSGIELVQTLRERGHQQPLIGLSSIGDDLNGTDWFDFMATKPISKSKLFNLILRCFLEGPAEPTQQFISRHSSHRQEPLTKESVKILIAEDDYYNQLLLTETLKTLNYKNLTVVSNGKLCLDAVKQDLYDICLMDVKMPIMDGLEATRLIKRLDNPPIVIGISASVLDSDKNRCFNAGMDGYLPKPVQKDSLESALDNIITKI